MFVDKWASGLRVTFDADGILIRARPEQRVPEGSMRIVAVGALHQPFGYFVMKGLLKCRLNIGVALVAEGRIAGFEQDSVCLELVDAVAADTTDTCFSVGGSLEIRVLANMAGKAFLVDLLRSCLAELKGLGRDSAALDVGLAGSVAAFTGHTLAVVLECQLRVWVIGKGIHLGLVADGACLRSRIPGWASSWFRRGRCDLRL